MGQIEEAIVSYRQALRCRPDCAESHNNLGTVLTDLGFFSEALGHYRDALRTNPRSAEAHNNLGEAFRRFGQLDEALASFHQALSINPDFAGAHNGLGVALRALGQLDEAMARFEHAIQLDPGYGGARWNRALLWLLLGDFKRGWPEYKWRWGEPGFVHRPFSQPLWDGSPLNGQTLLLHAEQGLGDTIQLIRYAQLASRRCNGQDAKVIVECQPPLCRLLAGQPGVQYLLPRGSALPAFDNHAPLGTLPEIFQTSSATIPADVPYLHPDGGLVKRWRGELQKDEGGRMKDEHAADLDPSFRLHPSSFLVGIAWQGNPAFGHDRLRSIPLAQFGALAKIRGIRLISLQKGPGTEQLEKLKEEGGRMKQKETPCSSSSFIVHPSSFVLDEASGPFMDTAAIMQSLDLVISSDTAIPHLAGAIGVPVWVALPFVPDWRWLLKREDSPWYPTIRLFRQTKLGCWEDVFERMADELKRIHRNND
jgi:hypothetical protein